MTRLRYRPPAGDDVAPFSLVAEGDGVGGQRFPFGPRIEVGRLDAGAPEYDGRLLVADPTVSSLHCVILQHPDGRLFVRDSSRNGTWLDGTRLIPNREQEIRPGQTLSMGSGVSLRLVEDRAETEEEAGARPAGRSTVVQPSTQDLAVLVGDVCGYTSLLTSVDGTALQTAVGQVFARLVRTIHSLGGQVKEYQGDSIMAFWEKNGPASPAIAACRAALALRREVDDLAADGTTWPFPHHPLRMDWAIATGSVSAQVLGADRPEELSLVGEAVVLAYRLEKAADDRTGPLLVCARTRAEASGRFVFEEVGSLSLAGFSAPVPAFRLAGEIPGPSRTMVFRASGPDRPPAPQGD
jgi:class 3 adenylate cyclase